MMTQNEIIEILNRNALETEGQIGNTEFCIMQHGPFNVYGSLHDNRFMAFANTEEKPNVFFCDTIEELLDDFIILGKPLREQLGKIERFQSVKCTDLA